MRTMPASATQYYVALPFAYPVPNANPKIGACWPSHLRAATLHDRRPEARRGDDTRRADEPNIRGPCSVSVLAPFCTVSILWRRPVAVHIATVTNDSRPVTSHVTPGRVQYTLLSIHDTTQYRELRKVTRAAHTSQSHTNTAAVPVACAIPASRAGVFGYSYSLYTVRFVALGIAFKEFAGDLGADSLDQIRNRGRRPLAVIS